MLSDALSYFSQLFYATNSHCFELQNVVQVLAIEKRKNISIWKIVWVVLYLTLTNG